MIMTDFRHTDQQQQIMLVVLINRMIHLLVWLMESIQIFQVELLNNHQQCHLRLKIQCIEIIVSTIIISDICSLDLTII